ncbi:conserved hypothetical protein [Candida dubliniensis CD36]|uniref:Uncharacterized protein n=1 Tax=Candida dubliniensis (strain CD36 / ATCC MYA-646 / CBS 7987 / NCPF 3949 / NRRL Y-17841) TaxID=573826 RepID=B9WC91_CANDC|nr:conserved hypothetical protein [Candida dubliniensis CD36]CAX44013.1 conserved hypothetical protein [Candida dubliniensis CD36]
MQIFLLLYLIVGIISMEIIPIEDISYQEDSTLLAPRFFYFDNLQTLQPKLLQIFATPIPTPIIQLLDTNHYLIPDDESNSEDHSNNTVPLHWIEFYTENISYETNHHQGIIVMTHETVDNKYAHGDLAYTWSMLKKFAVEYNMALSLYAGFYYMVGLLTGARISPEFDITSSLSIMYTCPVTNGRTVQLKVYPTLAKLTPYYRKLKWNSKLQKFIVNNKFTKHKRIKLLALTGLEDVECVYIHNS